MPIDCHVPSSSDFKNLHHLFIARKDTLVIHDLSKSAYALPAWHFFHIFRCDFCPRCYSLGFRNACRDKEVDLHWKVSRIVDHHFHPLLAKYIGNLVRICAHSCRSPWEYSLRKPCRSYHTALDMEMSIDQAGKRNGALCVYTVKCFVSF